MRVLVFGAGGWIGQQFIESTTHTVITARTRPEDYAAAEAEISEVTIWKVQDDSTKTCGIIT